ncbi:hypothetical protein BDV93DRAFT_519917 [Ceratobasidium sp. AG-I]|nr:hypothetical protein BDV93DRAFT_519917 [Ceratobasidium sp. AG-I]
MARSISPSTSLSSSQCTPVPGTPVASPFSATTSASSYLSESSGSPLASATSALVVPHDRDAYVKVRDRSPRNREPSMHALSPASAFMGGSEFSLSMFPSVPPERAGAHVQGRDGAVGGHAPDIGLHQKLLPTPPVTPAWFAQTFDTPPMDDPEMLDERHFSDHIPLAQSGNLARMRRQKHIHNSSSGSTSSNSSGGSLNPQDSPPVPRKAGARSSSAPDDRRRPARRI